MKSSHRLWKHGKLRRFISYVCLVVMLAGSMQECMTTTVYAQAAPVTDSAESQSVVSQSTDGAEAGVSESAPAVSSEASGVQQTAAPILRTTRIRAKMAGLPKTLQIPGHRKPLLLRRHQEDRLLQQEPRLKLSSPSRPGPKPVRKSSRQNLDRRNQSLQNLCLLHCPEKHRVLSTVRMR